MHRSLAVRLGGWPGWTRLPRTWVVGTRAGSGHITWLPLHNSSINNMCYQFPLGLQNVGAGDRGLLPAPGAGTGGGTGGDGGPAPAWCQAAPCPLPKPLAMGTVRLQSVAGQPWPGSTQREEGSNEGLQHQPWGSPLVEARAAPSSSPLLSLRRAAGGGRSLRERTLQG